MEQLLAPPPEAITLESVSYFINQKGIDPSVANIDLGMVKMKLMDSEEGPGWTIEQCDAAEIEYKRFLTLNKIYPDGAIVPNKTMDMFWHQHILDTRAYHRDCDAVFGAYFHHFPYFGIRGESDKQDLLDAFDDTQVRYEQHFGEAMSREDSSKCYSGCNSSGKCKSRTESSKCYSGCNSSGKCK